MAIRLQLKREVIIPDAAGLWADQETVETLGTAGMIELFEEDWLSLLEDMGGLTNVIEDVSYVAEPNANELPNSAS